MSSSIKTIKKIELAREAAKETGVNVKDANKVISAFLDGVKGHVCSGDRVELRGFGVFDTKMYTSNGRNPKTNQFIGKFGPYKFPKFKPSKLFKRDIRDDLVTN